MTAPEADDWLASVVGDAVAGTGRLVPGIDEPTYLATVDEIQRLIFEGDCYQVNFTFPLHFDWFGSPLALYARLRQRQPVRYGGVLVGGGEGIVSLSPELFLQRQGDCLLTRPMKGTASRDLPAERLRESEKDRAENLMIVDLLRNDLGRIARPGGVSVDRLFDIEAYPTVWQMVSSVSAQLSPGCGLLQILEALFPCGSITGAPKIRAMQIAADLETQSRGLYTGAFGWLAPNGDFSLNVAIRTLELGADGRGKLGIGSGIVADSQAEAEWRECLLKASFLRDADPGLSLIETLRLEGGEYPYLSRHLERLRTSAASLGFAFDQEQVCSILADQPKTGCWRVRLTLNKAGVIDVATFPLYQESLLGRRAKLADDRIRAGDLLRRHKTTARTLYDQALKQIQGDDTLFDVVFLNERGEVAEGARSNVFVEKHGVLLTPPVTSGALPGVLRAELLDTGRAAEAVLFPEDLVAGFWLGNALRGLVPVSLMMD